MHPRQLFAICITTCLAAPSSHLWTNVEAFALAPWPPSRRCHRCVTDTVGDSCKISTHRRHRHVTGRRRPGLLSVAAITADESTSEMLLGGKRQTELRFMTWIEVEARVAEDMSKTGSAAVIVPLGATEQHGPNGLIGTDHMTAEAVARGVSAATGAVLAPSVNYGMSAHHGSFAGTVTLSPATFVGVVRDVAASLERSGFTHILFINGHGGNVGPTYAAFSELKIHREQQRERQQQQENDGFEKRPSTAMRGNSGGEDNDTARGADAKESGGEPVGSSDNNPTVAARLKLISWYAGRESSALAKELYGNEVGQHATPDEVAVTQHLFPEFIKTGVTLDPAAVQVAKDLKGMTKRYKDERTGLSVMDSQDFRARFPDGRMFSNPGLATPEHGQQLLEAAVRDATETLRNFLSGEDLVEEAAAAAAASAASKGEKWRKPRWGRARGKRLALQK